MILLATLATFLILLLLSLPIVFCLGAAGVVGMMAGGLPLQQLSSTIVSASQSWAIAPRISVALIL